MRVLSVAVLLLTLASLTACDRQPPARYSESDLDSLTVELATALAAAQREQVVSPLEQGKAGAEAAPKASAPARSGGSRPRASAPRRSSSSSTVSRSRTYAPAPRVVTETHTKEGALIGAGTGAVVGAVAGGRGDRLKGAVIGGAVGAAAGAVIGSRVKTERVQY